jgi:alkylation response protein AidB-like acyl-CoA dehydrogenase
MQFNWTDDDIRFREELVRFLGETLPDDWDEISKEGPGSDAQVEFSKGFCRLLAERGWLTPHWPREYGGNDATPWQHAVLSEEMWSRGEPRGPQYMNVNWIGPTIMEFGTDEQKTHHLPPISEGRALWCQGFSEPEAGSDLVALRTAALRDGNDYVINGTKIWTSYANHADYCFLLARTEPESKRHKGISVLLVPMDTPGIELREIPSVVGHRYFHEIFFTDVRIPTAFRLGPENEGWAVVSHALQYERVGAPRYARAGLTLDRLAEYAKARGTFNDPTIQEKLGHARTMCEAARLLSYKVIDQRAKGLPPSADTNVARVAGTTVDRAVGELALEICGSDAIADGSFADANFRMSMTAGVAVGATEIQLNLIASRILQLPKE